MRSGILWVIAVLVNKGTFSPKSYGKVQSDRQQTSSFSRAVGVFTPSNYG